MLKAQKIMNSMVLVKKASDSSIRQFKRSFIVGTFFNKILAIMIDTDKPYICLMAFNFFALLKDPTIAPLRWTIERQTMVKLYERAYKIINDDLLLDFDIYMALKSCIILGTSYGYIAMRKLSQRLLAIN